MGTLQFTGRLRGSSPGRRMESDPRKIGYDSRYAHTSTWTGMGAGATGIAGVPEHIAPVQGFCGTEERSVI
jgi:hypothetical protein